MTASHQQIKTPLNDRDHSTDTSSTAMDRVSKSVVEEKLEWIENEFARRADKTRYLAGEIVIRIIDNRRYSDLLASLDTEFEILANLKKKHVHYSSS